MNTQQSLFRTTIIFIGLALAGIAIALCAQIVPDVFAKTLMIATGSAIFSSGLTFFLVRMSK